MANLRTIQFLRNASNFPSLQAAQEALIAQAANLADGSPIAGRYTVTVSGVNETRTILGIVANHTVSFFNNDKEIDNVLNSLDYGPIGGTAASVLTQIQQVDGKISGLTSNVGALTLSGYTKGTDSGTVVSTDSINAAIAKLENHIDGNKAIIDTTIDALDANSVADDNKVVTDVTQSNGKITATASNLTGVKLSGLAATADTKIVATDTLGEALGKLQGQIDSMDLTVVSGDGSVITSVSEADGKVSAAATAVKDIKLTGYEKTSATGDLAATDDIEDALSKIENNIAAAQQATTLEAADKSINVVTAATGTTVALNIRSGEKVLKLDTDATSGGVYTNLNVVKITESLPAEVKERYELRDSDNVKIGESIDIAKDSHIVSITYISDPADAKYQNLQYVYIDVSGNTQTEYVDVSSLVLEAEFASGVSVTNHVAHGVVDPISEKDGQPTPVSFLTVGVDGFKVDGIKNEIARQINDLDVAVINPGTGKYIYAIEENDGKVSASGANVSEAVLNSYSKGSDASAVDATDSVNEAISKLENQIDKAKAAATTKVEEGADNVHLAITSATGADESVTYTITLTDVASESALTEEIAARKAVDGQAGQTYQANSSSNYISNASNLNDADVKLAAAISELSGKTFTEIGSANNSISASTAATTNGTVKIDVQTDATKISGLSAFSSSHSEITGVTSTNTVSTGIDNLYKSLEAEVAARKAAITQATVKGSKAIGVSEAASGTTVTLKLSSSNDDGRLTIEDDGLKLSNVFDCGTFDEN